MRGYGGVVDMDIKNSLLGMLLMGALVLSACTPTIDSCTWSSPLYYGGSASVVCSVTNAGADNCTGIDIDLVVNEATIDSYTEAEEVIANGTTSEIDFAWDPIDQDQGTYDWSADGTVEAGELDALEGTVTIDAGYGASDVVQFVINVSANIFKSIASWMPTIVIVAVAFLVVKGMPGIAGFKL
jgi:hypothetical protein